MAIDLDKFDELMAMSPDDVQAEIAAAEARIKSLKVVLAAITRGKAPKKRGQSGPTPSSEKVVAALRERGPCRVADLAGQLGIGTYSNVYRIAKLDRRICISKGVASLKEADDAALSLPPAAPSLS